MRMKRVSVADRARAPLVGDDGQSRVARQAVIELLDLVIEHAPVGAYARALREYRDSLE